MSSIDEVKKERELFEALKEGDEVVIKTGSIGRNEHYVAVVFHRTKTRVLVKGRYDNVLTFTLDGRKYPRDTGYYGYTRMLPANEENVALAAKYETTEEIKHLLRKFEECIKNGTLDNLSTEALWQVRKDLDSVREKLLTDPKKQLI